MSRSKATTSSVRKMAAEAMSQRRAEAGLLPDTPLSELRLAERRAKRLKGLYLGMKILFGEECRYAIREEDQYMVALVDSLEFIITGSDLIPQVRLLGTCPQCDSRTPSVPLYTLKGLGEVLEEFIPDYSHTYSHMCAATLVLPVVQSAARAIGGPENGAAKGDGATAERLTEALDEFIRERLASVGDTAGEQTDDNSPSVDKAPARRQRKS